LQNYPALQAHLPEMRLFSAVRVERRRG